MPAAVSDNRLLAKNTVLLYARTVFALLIALFSSRVMLQALGVDDYGVFSLVGGFVTFFTFFTTSGSEALMRFFSYDMGSGHPDRLGDTFSESLYLFIRVAAIFLLVAETIGVFAVNTWINIAPERIAAANFTYQAIVICALGTIIEIPYSAAILAYERMDAYTVISLAHSLLKLVIALLTLLSGDTDSLMVYATLYLAAGIIATAIRIMFCRRCLPGTAVRPHKGKDLRILARFLGLDSFVNLCNKGRYQTINVLINRFGGTVLNAAMALSYQVSEAFMQMAHSFLLAYRPQVMKYYAAGDYKRAIRLFTDAGRFAVLLLAVFAAPMYIHMDYVLELWLGDVPSYTADFCRLCVLTTFGQALTFATDMGIYASGDIRRLGLVNGSLYLIEIPVAWILLRHSSNPSIVLAVHMAVVFSIVAANTYLLTRIYSRSFSALNFWWKAVAVPGLIFLATLALCSRANAGTQFFTLALCCAVSVLSVGILTWIFALGSSYRRALATYICTKTGIKLCTKK